MTQTEFAFVLAVGFFAIEPLFRQGKDAKSLERTASDKGSSILIVVLFWIVIILPPLLNILQVGQIESSGIRWLGLLIMVLGLGLRFWSMRVLGKYYTRTLPVFYASAFFRLDGVPPSAQRHVPRTQAVSRQYYGLMI